MVSKSSSSATPASLRRTHRGLMLSRIQAEPGVSRADLVRRFGFSEMALTRIARDLLAAEIIEEFDPPVADTGKQRRIGRPRIGLRIIPKGVFAAGITVSAYFSEVSICDANGQTIARQEVDNTSFEDAAETARLYSSALCALIKETGIDIDRIAGVGVALSANTSPDRNEIVRSEYFGWGNDGGQFWEEVRGNTGLPVEIENIANALALSEMRFGAARDVSEFALAHVATFAGVGAVSDGRVVRGASGDAGRIGHFRLEKRSLRCTCGRNDCLNLSATGFGLLAKLGKLDHDTFDCSKLPVYARSLLAAVDDASNADHLHEAGLHLAEALDPLAKILAPELIILSGTLGSKDAYFKGAEQGLTASFGYGPDSGFRLVKGVVSPADAASLLALHTFCYSDRLDYERLNNSASGNVKVAANA
ncbi:MAG: ROK family protein [Boseongicola sp. SB0664_bin_43]|uniref:ROK family protein n=1 Tax=Boseongicola sp. SB0664_bin_43 TaxID=2604844 RepID=A0A6B0Y4E7_9RHOB|nr:ROK family protein [Boseongicola sp. SB0664_bin_43]